MLKKKLTLQIFDVSKKSIQTDWTLSPSYERELIVKRIDMGVD